MERRLSARGQGEGTMFEGWGFLLAEVWVLIALALLVGLFVGWLIWGRAAAMAASGAGGTVETERLRAEIRAQAARLKACQAEVARLSMPPDGSGPVSVVPAQGGEPGAPEAPPETPADAVEPQTQPETAAEPRGDLSGGSEVPGTRPATLTAPRGGAPDDLKRIRGIGPKLEALCNRLGFWHFDQIAAWSEDEIAWVDANLETFKGRVTRDNWVAQARALAAEKS